MQTANLKKILTPLFVILGACSQDHTDVEIKIAAKSADGKPVSGATLSLDGTQIGETNAFGEVKTSVSLTTGKFHKLTLTKDDPHYYYAPHMEVFKASQNKNRVIDISPTMYLVPKPRFKNSHEEPKFLTEQSPPSLPTDIKPTTAPALPLLVQPSLRQTTHLSNFSASIQNTSVTPPTEKILITGHVYSGRLPVSDAKISWFNGQDAISCRTNERGRCTLKLPNGKSAPSTILVEKKNYLSQLLTTQNLDNENIRSSLELGRNTVIRVSKRHPWFTRPLSGVRIRMSGNKDTITNHDGLALIDVDARRSETLEIKDNQSGGIVSIPSKDIKDLAYLDINFPDDKNLGWTRTVMLPPHAEAALKSFENENFTQNTISETLQITSKGAINAATEDATLQDHKNGSLEILPILHNDQNQYQLSLIAFVDGNLNALSKRFTVRSAGLSGSWKSAILQSFSDLKQKITGPGIVTSVFKNDLKISFVENSPNLGDIVEIIPSVLTDEPRQPIKAKIVQVTGGHVRATILKESREIDSLMPWKLIGSTATTQKKNDPKIEALMPQQLVELRVPDKNLNLAKKYLAENNPIQALQIINESPANSNTLQAHRQLRSIIYQALGDLTALQHEQILMMKAAIENGHETAALTSEANILTIRAQNTPVIPNDSTIVDSLAYIISRTQAILAQSDEMTPELSLHLEYAKFLASRKKAECEHDLVSLASLASDLMDLNAQINQLKDPSSLKNLWGPLLDLEKSKISMASRDEDTKF
jgi:hypothetical protein